MRGQEIVDRLKQVLPLYTDDFSSIVNINFLSRSGSVITANAPSHGLVTNDYVVIKGAKEPILLNSITRIDNVATVTTSTDHKLSDPSKYASTQLPLYIEISGATPSDYNGVFELVSVPNSTTFRFKILTTPIDATISGTLLLKDFDGYNRLKQITVTDGNNFTYATTNSNLGTPAQGNLNLSSASRINNSSTPDRAESHFIDVSSQSRMYVVLGDKQSYKDGTIATDISANKYSNQDFYLDTQQDFSLFVFIPTTLSTLGGVESDLARSYEQPILKAIANYEFSSFLLDLKYNSTIYVGNTIELYDTAKYVHRFDFSARGRIVSEDTSEFDAGVPLQSIGGSYTSKDLEFLAITR